MHTRTRLGTAALAIALTTGVGLMGAPAHAKPTSSVSGTATLPLLPEILYALSISGTQFNLDAPAAIREEASGTLTFVFPVASRLTKGVLAWEGNMSVGSLNNRLQFAAPRLEISGRAGKERGRITFEIVDMQADGPADLANGTRIALFDVSPLKIKSSKGRTVKSGKKWERTDTQRITGSVSLTSDSTLWASIRGYTGSSALTESRPFSTLTTVITTKVTCATELECKKAPIGGAAT